MGVCVIFLTPKIFGMKKKIFCGDALEILSTFPNESVHCCITSPPYWGLRDYGVANQIGLEKTPEEYVSKLVEVFREVGRVLRPDATLWLNLGDSYATVSGGMEQLKKMGKDTPQYGAVPYHEGYEGVSQDGKRSSGLKHKDLCGIPWRVAFALQKDGWYLRSDIIWNKPNPMPESVTDRPTKSHEYIFLLTKNSKYFYNADAIKEPAVCGEARPDAVARDRMFGYSSKNGKLRPSKKRGEFSGKYQDMKGREEFRAIREFRNKRTVWTITTQPYKGAHFATFPKKLVEPCVLAGCPKGGVVCDPFCGSGVTGVVALSLGRSFVGIELNEKYIKLAEERIKNEVLV